MKLLFVGEAASVHTRRWIGYFASAGHEVHLATPATSGAALEAGVLVHPYPRIRAGSHGRTLARNVLALPRQVLWFRRLLRLVRPDVVHVHYINEAALIAKLAGASPLVLTAWGSDVLIAPQRSRIRRIAVRGLVRTADLVTCDATHMRDRLLEFGAHAAKVPIVFFGTDTRRFNPAARDDAVRSLYAAPGQPLIISLRNLEPVYDIPTLIRAMPAIVQARPEVRLVVAGQGSLAMSLEALVRELRLENHVVFVGSVPQDRLPALLASCDAYVSTALSDAGLSASTAEAMASGLPVIVTEVGDNPGWVQEGRAGYVIPPGDPVALADRLLRLLGSPELRADMGQAGRSAIDQRNNFSREMARMETLYREVVSHGR